MTTTLKNRPPAATRTRRSDQPVRELRQRYGMTRPLFARLMGVSERSLAKFEKETAVNPSVQRQITALDRLQAALARVIKAEAVGEWFQKPNLAFGGFKPLEVVERGEEDRIWAMIYELASGAVS